MRPFRWSSAPTFLVSCLALTNIATSGAFSQSAPSSSYSVVTQPQAVPGKYNPQQALADNPPQQTIGPRQNGTSNGIPAWVSDHLKDFSEDDSLRVQQLYMERHELMQQFRNPGADAVETSTDLLQAWFTGSGDKPPLQEERHQQRLRINKIETELQQIFDRNNILASPFAVDSLFQSSPQDPNSSFSNSEDFSISTSDFTPSGFPSQSNRPKPFDWQSGWQNRMQDMPSLNSPTTGGSGSGGIVIDTQLVSDSPAPTSGITIETQVLPNPSNDGIEAKAPVTPISIESSLSPNSPSGSTRHSAKGGGAHIDWAGVISDSLQILDAGVRAYDALHAPAISAPPSPVRAPAPASTNTLKRATTAPPQQTSHNTSPPPGTPGRGNPHPTPTPVPVSTPPPQNCSGGICCTPPSVPNPAAVACLNSPTPGCDHPNGPGSWLKACISR